MTLDSNSEKRPTVQHGGQKVGQVGRRLDDGRPTSNLLKTACLSHMFDINIYISVNVNILMFAYIYAREASNLSNTPEKPPGGGRPPLIKKRYSKREKLQKGSGRSRAVKQSFFT